MESRSNTAIFTEALTAALCGNRELADYFIQRHKINVKDEWLPTARLVDALYHVEEKVGSATVQKIGSGIARLVPLGAAGDAAFRDFLFNQLNDVYKLNHQMLESGFKVSRYDGGYYMDLANNPYPLTFNKGLILGFSFKHRALSQVCEADKDALFIESVM